MQDNIIALKRLLVDNEERLEWYQARAAVLERLSDNKLEEITATLENKINNLNNAESAMLNILEDSRELELDLRLERDRISAIIASMAEGLSLIDKNYKIVMLNATAEKMLEIAADQAIGQNAKIITDIYKGEERLSEDKRPVAITLKTGKIVKVGLEDNYYYKIPSGKRIPVAIITAPLYSNENNEIIGAVTIFRDITDEKKLDEAKSSFIATASHQLRTPLTAIRWYSEMLDAGDAGKLTKKQKEFIAKIYNGVLQLGETLNLLLALARIEGGRVKNEPINVNLIDFTDSIIKELEPIIKSKNAKVMIVAQKENTPEAVLDKAILSQVVTNLLSNAINYTDEEGIIEVEIRKNQNEIIYSVKDNGIGIPESQKDKIFQKLFRAENAVDKIPDGNGLGLALAKNLVEYWGGKIWFESPTKWKNKNKEENKGTIFYFTIPTNPTTKKW